MLKMVPSLDPKRGHRGCCAHHLPLEDSVAPSFPELGPFNRSLVTLGLPSGSAPRTRLQGRRRSLGREDPLDKEMAIHFHACLENPMDSGDWRATVHGLARQEPDKT